MNLKQYSFDIIIVRSDIASVPAEETESLRWDIEINGEKLHLKPDRCHVTDFPSTPLTDITTDPRTMCESLRTRGINVTVTKGRTKLGAGNCIIPQFILSQLFDASCILTHVMECELLQRKTYIGLVELNMRIKSIHRDQDTRHYDTAPYDICKPQQKHINPKDMLILLGRTNRTPAHTCITDRQLLASVAQDYDCGIPRKGDIPNPWQQHGCDCSNAAKHKKCDTTASLPALQQSKKQSQQYCCCGSIATSTSSSQGDVAAAAAQQPWPVADEKQLLKQKFLHAVSPKLAPLMQTDFKTPRRCLLCKEDISWCPKMNPCPFCGYKCMPEVYELPYDDQQTAAQVMQNYFRNDEKYAEPDKEPHAGETEATKACGCSSNRACTRCRIRKLCATVFKQHFTENVIKSEPEAKLADNSDIDAVHRAKLVNIFTEMRNIYDKKFKKDNHIVDTAQQLQDACVASECGRKTKADRKTEFKWEELLKPKYASATKLKKKRTKKPKFKSKVFSKLSLRDQTDTRTRHLKCLTDSATGKYGKVPCNVGWLWPLNARAQQHNWKPGSIPRGIREIMAYYLKDFPVDTICLSRYARPPKKSKHKPCQELQQKPPVQHPTLHIEKHNDEYTITLRPLKELHEMQQSPDPYVNMKPIRFRIIKSPFMTEQRQMKRSLRQIGFTKCTCGQPVCDCFCRSHIDKQLLLDEMARQRKHNDMRFDHTTSLVLSDTSDSESEYEFGVTPPAGVVRPQRGVKPDVVCAETQYEMSDWCTKPNFCAPNIAWSGYQRYFPCAVGELPPSTKKVKRKKACKKGKKCQKGKKAKPRQKAGGGGGGGGGIVGGGNSVAQAAKRLSAGEASSAISFSDNYEERMFKRFKGMTQQQRTSAAFYNRKTRMYFKSSDEKFPSNCRVFKF